MSPSRIIAFAKDWNDVPTCTTHILREMGKTMPVLWLNSIGMRRPQVTSGRDMRRILHKVSKAFHRAELKENHLHVLSPLAWPQAQSALMRTMNRRLLAWAVNRETSAWGNGQVELWAFGPHAMDFAGCFHEKKLIYYCPDDWTLFPNIDANWITSCEQEILRRADVVFATSRFLETKCRAVAGDRVHYMPHGVQYNHFATALKPSTQIPADLAVLPSPRIGYYGNIRDWIDFELLRQLATRKTDWSFVMVGPIFCDVSTVSSLPNVHFLGRREPEQLPAYCKGFDLAIIPYRTNDPRMDAINPVKLRELLAAGVPVVGSDLPELRDVSSFVVPARTVDDFLGSLEKLLQALRNNGTLRQQVSDERQHDDWSGRVREIRRIVNAA